MDRSGEWYASLEEYSLLNTDTTQMRKMVHNLLNQNVAQNYVPYQMLENKQMLNDLLDTPQFLAAHSTIFQRFDNIDGLRLA